MAEEGLVITSDGTSVGTVVTFDGKVLPHVKSVVWRCYSGEMAQVEIEMMANPVVVNAVTPPEVVFVCGVCEETVDHKCTGRSL